MSLRQRLPDYSYKLISIYLNLYLPRRRSVNSKSRRSRRRFRLIIFSAVHRTGPTSRNIPRDSRGPPAVYFLTPTFERTSNLDRRQDFVPAASPEFCDPVRRSAAIYLSSSFLLSSSLPSPASSGYLPVLRSGTFPCFVRVPSRPVACIRREHFIKLTTS